MGHRCQALMLIACAEAIVQMFLFLYNVIYNILLCLFTGAMERFAPDERERNQLVGWVAEACSVQAQSEWAIELFRYGGLPGRALRILSHLFSDRLEPALSDPASGWHRFCWASSRKPLCGTPMEHVTITSAGPPFGHHLDTISYVSVQTCYRIGAENLQPQSKEGCGSAAQFLPSHCIRGMTLDEL